MELEPIKCSSLLPHAAGIGWSDLPLEEGETLAERETLEEFDKTDQVAATATTMAVEQILTGVDVEGRVGIVVQGAEPDELVLASGAPSNPVALLQILQ